MAGQIDLFAIRLAWTEYCAPVWSPASGMDLSPVWTATLPSACVQIEPERPNQADVNGKKLVRRSGRDRSQQFRRVVQATFLALNLFIGVQFYFFVRYFETGGRTAHVSRPPGVEGWLPIAGLMNLKFLLVTGRIPDVHPAAMFLLISFLIISLVFRKAFCSWLCPIGTLSELLWKLGRRLFRWDLTLPRWADLPLRSLKYVLLGLFVYAVLPFRLEVVWAGCIHRLSPQPKQTFASVWKTMGYSEREWLTGSGKNLELG